MTGSGSTVRSLARSTFAHQLIVAAAAMSTGSPARVRLRTAPVSTALSAIANSTQPTTW
jgi:hypothetical protein